MGFGKKNEWIIPHLLQWTTEPSEVRRLSLRKEALYREFGNTFGFKWAKRVPAMFDDAGMLAGEASPAVLELLEPANGTIAMIVTLSIAALSWRFIERDAIRTPYPLNR